MLLTFVIGLTTIILALNGLLFQPKKDPNGSASWKNLNRTGRILLILIGLIGFLNLAKSILESTNNAEESKKKDAQITNLQTSQNDLKETNNYLVKVMSVAGGYRALVTGKIAFSKPLSDIQVRDALQNLFLKYVEINLYAQNKLGHFSGRLDYGTDPLVRKFRSIDPSQNLYSFEIQCSGLKILNEQKIQYARLDAGERVSSTVNPFSYYDDYQRLYHVRDIWLNGLNVEELEEIPLEQRIPLNRF